MSSTGFVFETATSVALPPSAAIISLYFPGLTAIVNLYRNFIPGRALQSPCQQHAGTDDQRQQRIHDPGMISQQVMQGHQQAYQHKLKYRAHKAPRRCLRTGLARERQVTIRQYAQQQEAEY